MKYPAIILCLLLSVASVSAQTRRSNKRSAPANATTSRPDVSVPPAEGYAFKLPTGYSGHNAGTVFSAIRSLRGSLRKDQFETTIDYESRVKDIVAHLPGVNSRLTFLLPDVKVRYDADAGAFRLDTQPESILFPTVYMAGDWSRQYNSFTSYFLVWNKKTIGSAVGRNAFGMKKRIVITSYTSLRLAVPGDSVRKLNRGILLPAVPAVARTMVGGIRLAITGQLIPPYGGEETDTDTATMTDPEEAHYFKFYIFFRPDTAVVYDIRTGEVYGSLDLTQEEKPAGRSSYLSYSEPPVVLEDPLTRQQKREEAQREYPPDRIFKSSEVNSKARILSQPPPNYTEEARSARVAGTVRLRAVFKYDGTIEVIEVLQGLTHGLTEKAVEAAKKIRFTPAQRNGKSVSQEIILEYNFNLY